MKIDYASSAMDAQDFTKLFENSPHIPGQQAQKYNRLIIQGLAANGAEVRTVTARPVTSANCRSKFLPAQSVQRDKVQYHYCSVLNVKGLKVIWKSLTAFFVVLLGGCDAIITDVLNASVAYGTVTAARLCKKPCIGIVTDLPELMVTGTNQKHIKLVRKVMQKCTGYILLTEAMNEEVNPEHKPYVIIEALCDSKIRPQDARKKDDDGTKKCMYAGLLDVRYGVKDMVDGFILAGMPDVELHIYGSGPYVEELKATAQQHPSVVYHGTAMNDEVVRAEMDADLLINPRPTHEEFTKYSFPSKNMEYMASGTPVLTTKLPGMPSEYYPYVYLFDDESIKGMAKTFKKVLSMPKVQLQRKGRKAQQFVLEKKNNIIQAKKVIDLISWETNYNASTNCFHAINRCC